MKLIFLNTVTNEQRIVEQLNVTKEMVTAPWIPLGLDRTIQQYMRCRKCKLNAAYEGT